jgi:hypothetical protein
MAANIKKYNYGLLKIRVLICLSVLLSGCSAVSLVNRTNQGPDNPNYYSSNSDIFIKGRPYIFKLLVKRENARVPYSSIKPSIIVNGQKNEMTLEQDWNHNTKKSLWSYQIKEKCPNVGFASNYGFKYSFSVNYERPNRYVSAPPEISPSSGKYHARVFDAGTLHFDPYEASYDPICWNTNMECVPTFSFRAFIYRNEWPGSNYEYTLTLRNLSPADYKLLKVALVSYQGQPPNTKFEIVGTENLPAVIGCEQTYDFKIRYRPGFYREPGFTPGYYRESGMIKTWVEDPYRPSELIGGPYIYIDYGVEEAAI